MREFMTQSEVVNEFVSFITANGLLEKYIKMEVYSRYFYQIKKFIGHIKFIE